MKGTPYMKNILKRTAVIAMAFALLGTGTAVTKTVLPKSDNTLSASAELNHQYKFWKYTTSIEGNYVVVWAWYKCINNDGAVYKVRHACYHI